MQSENFAHELERAVVPEADRLRERYEPPMLTEHRPLHDLTGSSIRKFGA